MVDTFSFFFFFWSLHTGPSGYPQDVKVIVDSSTSLSVSWNEVLESERNGNITHYDVLYTPVLMEQQPNKVLSTIGPVLAFTLKGLEEFTEYRVSVRAVTIVGSGPLSPSQTHRTEEDGKQMLAQCMHSQYHLSLHER